MAELKSVRTPLVAISAFGVAIVVAFKILSSGRTEVTELIEFEYSNAWKTMSFVAWTILAFMVLVLYFIRKNLANESAKVLLKAQCRIAERKFDEAAEMLDGLIKASGENVNFDQHITRGELFVLTGEPEKSIASFQKALKQADANLGDMKDPFKAVALERLSRVNILLGELEKGGAHLDDARNRIAEIRRGSLCFCESMLAVREGRDGPAVKYLAEDWHLAEAVSSASQMKQLRILRAMALSNVDATRRLRWNEDCKHVG